MKDKFVRYTLLTNGIVDILSALALFFPILNLPLPGYQVYTKELAFVAGGWAVAALTFGIGRIWTSYRREFYRIMVILGLIEGGILTLFCLVNLSLFGISLLQAMLPLGIGSVYGILYFIAFMKTLRG